MKTTKIDFNNIFKFPRRPNTGTSLNNNLDLKRSELKSLPIKKSFNFSPNVKSTIINKEKNDIESNYEETEQGSVNKIYNNCNINNQNDIFFLKKNKKMYETPTVNNCKRVTFERQSDKKIFNFPIFDDNLIFTNINKSYMHNEDNDDGSSSSEETIEAGKRYLYSELDEVASTLHNNLLSGKSSQKLFRRKYIFDNVDKVGDINKENKEQANK